MNKNKLKFISIAIITAGISLCFAQTVTPHFTERSKKIVLPKDALVNPNIRDGMITVSYGGNGLAYVNTEGKYVFGTDFPVSIGNAFVNSGLFSGGAVTVWRKKKPDDFGVSPSILYPNGKYKDLPNDISFLSQFEDGVAIAQKGDNVIMGVKQIFMDKNGKEIYPKLTSTQKGSIGDTKIYPLREKHRVYYNADLKKYGYADDKGNIAIKPQYEKALSFSEGLAAVQILDGQKAKWGFIDTKGKMVVPATYILQPGKFSEGLAAVRIGEADYDFEMAYIDKTGKRVIDNVKWFLNEFSGGFAWVKKEVCGKLVVIDKEFKEVSTILAENACNFKMQYEGSNDWGFDFPNGQIAAIDGSALGEGDIYTPNGSRILRAVDPEGNHIILSKQTEGELYFAKVYFKNEPHLGAKDVDVPLFMNAKGEIIYYFQQGNEGYEGPKPTAVK
ncbi:MAG: WG repeat-containing protein [Candidatus Fibromonas sp.]|jgi:hypothetical protein|nr:WG repeat-containing protein [Candidatus Fibromonas sp.]